MHINIVYQASDFTSQTNKVYSIKFHLMSNYVGTNVKY